VYIFASLDMQGAGIKF